MPLKSHRLLCFFVLLSSAGKPLIWWMPWKYVSCFQMNFRFSSPTWCCWLCSLPLDIVRFSEKAMAPHSSTLAWKIPWMEEPGRLQSMSDSSRPHFHFSLSCIGEGNGNPLQCSCLENRRDWGAWQAESMGSHRVGHNRSDLAAVAAAGKTTRSFDLGMT